MDLRCPSVSSNRFIIRNGPLKLGAPACDRTYVYTGAHLNHLASIVVWVSSAGITSCAFFTVVAASAGHSNYALSSTPYNLD